ncbi:aquaporin-like [Babylonia areolata]|uniref:aquaporin-like n=1 Tax=Babylonia areolata TaxID=304850 RepID=UPI003FD5509A
MWKIMKENLEDLLSPNLWRSIACETLGTTLIVLLGCGSWISSHSPSPSSPSSPSSSSSSPSSPPQVLPVALTFGLAVATMLWVFAHVSGGHFNPALTTATVLTRRVSVVRGVLYVLAQMVGGVVGAGVLCGLDSGGREAGLGATRLMGGGGGGGVVVVSQGQAFGVEAVITFVWVVAYFASRDAGRSDVQGSSYPLTVGLAVVVGHLFAINYTGAGMNCARSFGPAVILNTWDDHWVYWVGPLTGGVLAGLLYEYVFSSEAGVHRTTKCLLPTKRPATNKPTAAERPPEEGTTDGAAPEVIEMEEKDEPEPKPEPELQPEPEVQSAAAPVAVPEALEDDENETPSEG